MDFAFNFANTDIDELSTVEKEIILDIALLFMLSISHFFTLESMKGELKSRYNEVATYFHKLKEFCNAISPSLEKALSNLKFPRQNADSSDWGVFENKFRSITIKHADIGYQWSLTETNIESLRKYLVANSIILDALPVAYIDNRKQVLEEIFKKSEK